MDQAIVIYDPRREMLDGEVIRGNLLVAGARRVGVLVLPYESDRKDEAVGGFFRRGWGGLGFRYPNLVGARGCEMMFHAETMKPWLYWCAWVIPTGPTPQGILRLTSNTARQTAFAGGLSAVGDNAIDITHVPQQFGGWAIGGRSKVNITGEGYMALSLYGVVKDIGVVVAAVSQCAGEHAYP